MQFVRFQQKDGLIAYGILENKVILKNERHFSASGDCKRKGW